MKEIIFDGVSKSYDKNTKVLDNLNFKINEGERLVLLGPSGCGKSTTLRIIAGLSSITSGNLILGGKIANDLEPKDRNISMVFQNYALYPHMTVRENICYALKINKISASEIERRLNDVLVTLKLEGLEDRKPKDLSGGQRQRVALARALVKQSDYFLLDEPLSNLDAQLRFHARKELVKLHEKYKMTLVYVTHDQVEAMTIGQRIVLLNKGKIQMADSPDNIYNHPVNVFTATFIGSPSMNIIKSKVKNNEVYIGDYHIKLPKHLQKLIENYDKDFVYIGIRPEYIEKCEESKNNLKIKVNFVEDYGNKLGVYFDIDGSEHVFLSEDKSIKKEDTLFVKFDLEKICLFDTESKENLEVKN